MIGQYKISQNKRRRTEIKLLETVIVQKESIILPRPISKSQTSKIVYVNPAYTSMTGFDP
jgi:hypothetical protein